MPIFVTSSTNSTFQLQQGDEVVIIQGVNIYGSNFGLRSNFIGADDMSILVQGQVYGDIGIDTADAEDGMNNSNFVVAQTGGVFGFDTGMAFDTGTGNAVTNFGMIQAGGTGIHSNGGEMIVSNHGSITSLGDGLNGAIYFGDELEGTDTRIVINTGLIESAVAPNDGPDTNGTIESFFGTSFTVNNSGTIIGSGGNAIVSSAEETDIQNSGLIVGNIVTFDETTLSNTGTINGSIILSDDDDTYTATSDAIVTGGLFLNDGYDYAALGNNANIVFAGQGEDTVLGGTASDMIDGGDDADLLRGRAGDDVILGGDGWDTIRGGAGDDELFGGSGDDFIRGGAGEDAIIGEAGSDTMIGGAGGDTFIFENPSDSPDTSQRDVIQDFTVGEDLIDLTELGVLDYIGSDGFSGNGMAEVQVSDANSIGRVKVLVDVDGDGDADMKIVLNNTTNLSEDDFLLLDPLILA